MKLMMLFLAVLVNISTSLSQPVPNRLKRKSEEKVNHTVDQTIDKTVDAAFNKTSGAIGNVFRKKKSDNNNGDTVQNNNTAKEKAKVERETRPVTDRQVPGAPATNGKSEVDAGGTIIFEDHFEQDALGDFPAQWNTNGSGSIVTINGVQGKWLSVAHNSIVHPVLTKKLPENCIIEFDLFLSSDGSQRTPLIQFGLTPVKDILKEDIYRKNKFFIAVNRYDEADGKSVEYGISDVIGNKNDFPLTSYLNKVLHVAIAINKTRVRLYLADEKLVDLPRAITPDMMHNFFFNNTYVVPASELGMLVGNVKITSSDVDARSLLVKQLMEEGKTSTTEILFDVNSDVIKQESFGIVNQFGDALVKNPSLKIKITGHTDSDGADAANLELSKKRAAAVKAFLTENFPVTGSRIQTDGKGETQPVDDNKTASGKANNRRVEFTKL